MVGYIQLNIDLFHRKIIVDPSAGAISMFIRIGPNGSSFGAISTQIIITKIFCWSDSKIALSWIKQVQKYLKIRVENHVEKIRSNEPIYCWRYITADQIPAEVAKREVTHCVLLDYLLWWEDLSLLKI